MILSDAEGIEIRLLKERGKDMFIARLVVGIILIGATPLQAQIGTDQFNLFTRCQPVSVQATVSELVAKRQDRNSHILPILDNMTREIEIYLKNMRLYDRTIVHGEEWPRYILRLHIVSWYGDETSSSETELQFHKVLYDGDTNEWGWAQTWVRSLYWWGGDPGENYSVLGLVREFVQEYMAVNEPACNKS